MNLGQALVYFVREASRNLVRSWKTSLLAVLTIAISLFVGGLFLLATQNLAAQARAWSEEFQVTIYLAEGTSSEERERLLDELRAPFVRDVRSVSSDEARQRFEVSFPSLAGVFTGSDAPFAPSLEVAVDPSAAEDLDAWLEALRETRAVEMVDDDRDWLGELSRLITVVRGIGLGVGLGLLVAAVLTTASVIKLTAYLYLEEIQVLRLVGATEFFIRGPFYVEGLLQGLLGGVLSLVSLFALTLGLRARVDESFWLPYVTGDFLDVWSLGALLLLGGVSGLFGAVVSLRRESLRPAESD